MKQKKIIPLVSVIIPAYNHEQYVLDALNSVYEQSHERIEIIFIDDASSDDTYRLACSLLTTPFRRRFERIEITQKKANAGAHDSLNIGLGIAKGQYIAFLNSDDRFHPKRLETLLGKMAEVGSEFGFSLVNVFAEEGDMNCESRDSKSAQSKRVSDPNDHFILFGLKQKLMLTRDPTIGFALLRQNVAVSTGNFVLSNALATAIGRFMPLKYCHDWDFVLQCLVWTEPVCVLEPLYDYRLHRANSFRGLSNVAELETEVTLRRFFRQVSRVDTFNPMCPSLRNWEGYFKLFLAETGYTRFWDIETGNGLAHWRIYERVSKAPFGTRTGFR